MCHSNVIVVVYILFSAVCSSRMDAIEQAECWGLLSHGIQRYNSLLYSKGTLT